MEPPAVGDFPKLILKTHPRQGGCTPPILAKLGQFNATLHPNNDMKCNENINLDNFKPEKLSFHVQRCLNIFRRLCLAPDLFFTHP